MADEVTEKPVGMMAQVKQNNEEIRAAASGRAPAQDDVELPSGRADDDEDVKTAPEEKEVETKVAPEEKEEPIILNGKEFSSTKEALKYAEQLEQEKLIAEARNMGIQDALQYQSQQVAAQVPAQEDNFDEKFYGNPKETLRQVKEEAKSEALSIIRAEQQRENLWSTFLSENPGIRRKDAERVLNENWETIGKMTDVPKAMKILAQKVKADYDEIEFQRKPRSELPETKRQAVSAGRGESGSVTPAKKEERPLTLTEQMRQLRGH